MWKKLEWTVGGTTITMTDDRKAPIFLDFNDFNPHGVAGVFDERSSPGLDGAATYSAALSKRQPQFTARVLGFNVGTAQRPVETVLDEYTKLLCEVFSPRVVGRLTYTTNNGAFYLDCRPTSLPAFGGVEGGTFTFTVGLSSDSPYWKSVAEHRIDIGDTEPVIGYPSELPRETGRIISALKTVYNFTNLEQYPIVRFWPCNSAPILTNKTTGKYVALNRRLSDGFYIDIDTAPERNTVILWRLNEDTGKYEELEDVSYWLTIDSATDFSLVPGPNMLSADNIVAGVYPAASVIWHDRALGV